MSSCDGLDGLKFRLEAFIKDYYLQYTNFLSPNDKEQVIVSPVITVYTLRKKGQIQAVSVPSRLPSSLGP